ncbi:hypothetical protein PNEG_01293 [Pneumocystis murina B123]|uniref:ELMO domain-containing protein n=1 Tax=Pneumocystis murina (strain B123) TaxID=1069680 RepID=M7NPF1_PNEMU|nr:hypothetical protein PNEG_01293 [Pneumocystis murina B123]EMR10588.1 hypothetical protein PNEG_01293 [Pneumocystis murina B123]
MILNDIIIHNIIRKRILNNSLKKKNKKDIFWVFLKDSICETIWRIRRIYKRIYRIVSHKTSICRILDSYISLEESSLKWGEERRKIWNIEENKKLESLVWNIYVELCLSVSVYSEWKDLLYRAGSLDSFEEIKFIDTVITSILLKKKIEYSYREDMCSKQCLCLRYSVMSIFFIQKEKKSIMQKCLTEVEYYQNQKMFEEIWDALIVSGKGIQNNKKNWVMLGFQGDDPSTDFRSMGIFGLQLLHHFVLTQNEYTKIMISESRSNHTDINLPWYSFALAAINILAYIIDLMNENRLERIFIQCYNYSVYVEETIKHLFCYTFISFHHFWRHQVSTKNVRTVFDFERCLKRFKKETRDDITMGNNMFKF